MPTRNDTLEPIVAARINEHRQAVAVGELSDESIPLAGGVVNYAAGVEWANHAILVGFDAEVEDAELDRMESFYRERSVRPRLEITTFAPESFLAKLAARCYVVEHFENVLTCTLGGVGDPFASLEHGPPRGLTITRLDTTDDAACREHATIVSGGFVEGPVPEPHIAMGVRSLRHPRSVSFLARIDGEPAGAASMEVFACEAGRGCSFWAATVLEPFRRRGVQQALIARRLAYAIEEGCTLAFIESKPGVATERNAARFGFGLCYVRPCMAGRIAPAAPAGRARASVPAS